MSEITAYVDRYGTEQSPPDGAVRRGREGVFAVFFHDNKLLLISPQKAPDVLELPGGGIDPGEDAKTALHREVLEETGFDLPGLQAAETHEQYVGYFADDTGPDGEYWSYRMTFHLIAAETLPAIAFDGERATPEDGTMRWIPVDELDEVTVIATHRAPIRRLLRLL